MDSNDVRARVGRGLGILQAVRADMLSGMQFQAENDVFPAGRGQVEAVLLRVEQLLQELVQLLRSGGRGKSA